MALSSLQRILEWSSLLALAVCAVAALRVALRTRTAAPFILCISATAIVVGIILIEVLPSYDLRPDRGTGNIVMVEQYHTLHRFLYLTMITADLAFAAAFWALIRAIGGVRNPSASPETSGSGSS